MRKLACLLIIFLLSIGTSKAQGHSLLLSEYHLIKKDSVEKQSWTRAKKATVLSAVIPGAGQIYNKKYWKAGIVYGGFIGLTYMYVSNTDSFRNYQQAYAYRLDDDSTTIDDRYPFLGDASVRTFRDYHRRLRDISILGFVGLYALQIIDANVDAHLHEFRVNEDLSMRLQPQIRPSLDPRASIHGLKLSISF